MFAFLKLNNFFKKISPRGKNIDFSFSRGKMRKTTRWSLNLVKRQSFSSQLCTWTKFIKEEKSLNLIFSADFQVQSNYWRTKSGGKSEMNEIENLWEKIGKCLRWWRFRREEKVLKISEWYKQSTKIKITKKT